MLSHNHKVDSTDYGIVGSIQINGEEIEGFDPDVFSYNIEMPTGTAELPKVTATPVDSRTFINITPLGDIPGSAQVEAISCDSSITQVYNIYFSFLTSLNYENTDYSFQVYPNPAKDKITIQLNNEWEEHCTFILTDSCGKVLINRDMKKTLNNIEFEVSGFSKGLYSCNVILKDRCLTKKIIVW